MLQTHTIRNTAVPLQHWLHERASMYMARIVKEIGVVWIHVGFQSSVT